MKKIKTMFFLNKLKGNVHKYIDNNENFKNRNNTYTLKIYKLAENCFSWL